MTAWEELKDAFLLSRQLTQILVTVYMVNYAMLWSSDKYGNKENNKIRLKKPWDVWLVYTLHEKQLNVATTL